MDFKQITLKSGEMRWEAYSEGPTNGITGKRQQVRRRGKSKSEARRRVLKALNELENSSTDPRVIKKITFEKAGAEWFDLYSKTGVKETTLEQREYALSVLNRLIGDAIVASISHKQYQKVINMLAERYERETVKSINTTAGMVFKQAMKDGIIDKSPRDGVTIPKRVRTVEEIENNPIEEKYLSRKELEEFLETTKTHGLELDLERFYLLAFTGMRPGELCALKWSDINFKKNQIRITKTLRNKNNRVKDYSLYTPKTFKSARTIDVDDVFMVMLRDHRKKSMVLNKQYRDYHDDFHEGNFVFSRPNGYPYARAKLWERMNRIMKLSNLNKKATPHFLRHTHISMLTEIGVDLPTIMDRVGHSDPKTTLEIYTHVSNKMKESASEKIKANFGNLLENITN